MSAGWRRWFEDVQRVNSLGRLPSLPSPGLSSHHTGNAQVLQKAADLERMGSGLDHPLQQLSEISVPVGMEQQSCISQLT